MILTPYKAVYIHIPKTAGQSIENFFLSAMGKNRTQHGSEFLLRKNTDQNIGPKRLAHLSFLQYGNLGYLDMQVLESSYTFAFVRNPWDRVVSFYKYSGFSNLISFKHFVIHYLPELLKTNHWFYKPQFEFICNSNQQLAPNFIGRFEQLNQDFKIVATQLNIPFTALPKDNISTRSKLVSRKSLNLLLRYPKLFRYLSLKATSHATYRDYYCSATQEVVSSLYAVDITTFNYTF